MRFIDTHSHLYDEAFHQEEDQAIERAVEAGVTKMILPDIDSQSRDAMFTLADRHPDTAFPCWGCIPHPSTQVGRRNSPFSKDTFRIRSTPSEK